MRVVLEDKVSQYMCGGKFIQSRIHANTYETRMKHVCNGMKHPCYIHVKHARIDPPGHIASTERGETCAEVGPPTP